MNKLIFAALTAVAFLASSLNSEAQGRVIFSNTLNNRITNSLTSEPISGTNAFCIGLYVGPNGSTAAQLTLVGLTTNAPSGVPTDPFAGLFNGGNPFKLPIPYDDSAPVAFQIRAWTLADGTSYEAALLSGDPNLLIGQSALGWVIPTLPPSPPSSLPNLFGVGPGQVSAFSLVLVPEPSTLALAGLGTVLGMFFRRRKYFKFTPPNGQSCNGVGLSRRERRDGADPKIAWRHWRW